MYILQGHQAHLENQISDIYIEWKPCVQGKNKYSPIEFILVNKMINRTNNNAQMNLKRFYR